MCKPMLAVCKTPPQYKCVKSIYMKEFSTATHAWCNWPALLDICEGCIGLPCMLEPYARQFEAIQEATQSLYFHFLP